jgi:hypothetical protein
MRGIKVAIALLLLVTVSAFASDAAKMDVGKSWSLTLYHPTRVGTALLPTGEYNVRYIKEGEQHFLVFKSDGKEVARVHCTTEQLPSKADKTSLLQSTNGAGERVLMGIAFAGARFQHNLSESVAQVR